MCEGSKTECNYFGAIRIEKRIPSAAIAIMPSEYGTEPLQIVEYAEDHFRENNAFDRIYAVFDRDDHLTYANALTKAASLDKKLKNDFGKKIPFTAIPSVPNFELWVLLHFRDIHQFLPREDVYAALKGPDVYPGYAKNSKTVFAELKDRLDQATARALYLRQHFSPHPGNEPYTDADELTQALHSIAGLRR